MPKTAETIKLEDLKLSPAEMAALVKGAQRYVPAEPDPRDDETQPNSILTRDVNPQP